jgi:hypothetical protein
VPSVVMVPPLSVPSDASTLSPVATNTAGDVPVFDCGGRACKFGAEVCCVEGDATCRPRPEGADESWSVACKARSDVDVYACTDSADCDAGVCCTTYATPGVRVTRCVDDARECAQVEHCRAVCKTPETHCVARDIYGLASCAPTHARSSVRCGHLVCSGATPVCRFDPARPGAARCVGADGMGGDGPLYECTSRRDCGGALACVGESDGLGGTSCEFASGSSENAVACLSASDCAQGERCVAVKGGPGLRFCRSSH